MSISPSNNVHLTPNYTDNEPAAEYLRTQIGPHDGFVEGMALRPNGLIDEAEVSEYGVHASPTRSVIFDAGKASRINVGYFTTELITDDVTWSRWVGQMPVIYSVLSSAGTATAPVSNNGLSEFLRTFPAVIELWPKPLTIQGL